MRKIIKNLDSPYIVLMGIDDEQTDIYACDSKEDALEVLGNRILQECEFIEEETVDALEDLYFDEPDLYATVQYYRELIERGNLSIESAQKAYDDLFADGWWFVVIDTNNHEVMSKANFG